MNLNEHFAKQIAHLIAQMKTAGDGSGFQAPGFLEAMQCAMDHAAPDNEFANLLREHVGTEVALLASQFKKGE
jgi:hypothetical protein